MDRRMFGRLVAGCAIGAARGVMFLLGLTVSVGSSGVIALSAIFYPTAMRSAGTGWVMSLGRFGQVCSPLVISVMLALQWTPDKILAVMALAPFLGGVCVVLKSVLSPRHGTAVTDATVAVKQPDR